MMDQLLEELIRKIARITCEEMLTAISRGAQAEITPEEIAETITNGTVVDLPLEDPAENPYPDIDGILNGKQTKSKKAIKTETTPEPVKAEEPPTKVKTTDELKSLILRVTDKKACKEILAKHGYDKVSSVSDEDRDEIYGEIEKLPRKE